MDATTMSVKDLDLAELKIEPGSGLIGRTINDADRMLSGVGNIIAVMDVEGLKQIPEDSYQLKEGDRIIMVVNLTALPKGRSTPQRIDALIRKRNKQA
jgi:Trk K+ transport system NAD-binding subunit